MERRKKKSVVVKTKSSRVAIKERIHNTRFGQNHNKKLIPATSSQVQNDGALKPEASEQHCSEQEQAKIEEVDQLIALRSANIGFFLVYCVAFIFIVFAAFSLYEFHITGNWGWIATDLPIGAYFWKLVEHFALRK
jgi:hypothetical protein